jgi:predicted metal-dependent HD superfamily phosphohydrolase
MVDRLRFQHLWSRIGASDSTPVFERLRDAYDEPHRAYHNAVHICDCLTQFDRVFSSAERPDEVETAIWFHDVVYDPHAKDNEERSADWAVSELAAAGVPADLCDRVRQLILATKHDGEPTTLDARLLVDIDLTILGRDPDVFDAYDRAIRREYDWVSEAEFRVARAKILRRFLSRPAIFQSPEFAGMEVQARRNLERALRSLGGEPC